MSIRAVIFDLGHTLWDIGPGTGALERAYEDARATIAARLGRDDLPAAIEFQHAVRAVLIEAAETYFRNDHSYSHDAVYVEQPPSALWIDRGCRALGVVLDSDLLAEVTPALFATEIDSLIVADGTIEALAVLHERGYGLGCITNTLAGTAAIRAMLRRYNIESMMGSLVVSADEGFRKPHRSLFEKSLRELRVEPAEAIFVGDSPTHDIAGAKASGMRAVLTRQYVARPYESFEPQPDAVIDHLRELPTVISRFDSSGGRGGARAPSPEDAPPGRAPAG